MKILVTGAAGFIGFHLSKHFLARGHEVVGLDNLNDYYSVELKLDRLRQIESHPNFAFAKIDLADGPAVRELFDRHRFSHVVNLAAQAGVRYSLENPRAYIDSNIVGFFNIMDNSKTHEIEHLAYASSSSVYGLNTDMPFSSHSNVDHPLSLYAASKKSNELMAHTYSHLYGLPTTGLRFFTVYGPWGRPDMALFLFTKAILEGKPIRVFNHGKMRRDFTYIDDIVEGVVRVLDQPKGYRIFNIGNNRRVPLMRYIEAIEAATGCKADLELLPMQPGDVPATEADTSALDAAVGFKPATPVEEGVQRFVDWYRAYYGVPK
jgi:UDP-glucuronate 4-epimerase